MRSAARGKRTSDVEVTNLSKHGFWILVEGRELCVAFGHFPWFREAPVGHILDVELPGPDHLYWPKLDVDLSVESIEQPEAFPLISRAPPGGVALPVGRKRKSERARPRAAGRPRSPRSS